jgi:hypothetical protein
MSGSDNSSAVTRPAVRRADEEVPMSDYTMIVFTSPAEGREDEYNKWYDEVHLPEFSALDGVISGKRYNMEGDKPQWAAIYELSVPPSEVFKAMNVALKEGKMHMSDSMDPKSAVIHTLTPR